MKSLLILLLPLLWLLGGPAAGQSGLAGGWSIIVAEEDGTTLSDIRLALVVGGALVEAGRTGQDGRLTVAFSVFELRRGTSMEVERITENGLRRVVLTPSGERSDPCRRSIQSGGDCTVLSGQLVWGAPAEVRIGLDGEGSLDERPQGPGIEPEVHKYSVELGGHIGHNIDFKEPFGGLQARVFLLSLPYPIAIDAVFSLYPMGRDEATYSPALFASWVQRMSDRLNVSAGMGFEISHTRATVDGEKVSNTIHGAGLVGEISYAATDRLIPAVDVTWINYDSGWELSAKLCVRVRL